MELWSSPYAALIRRYFELSVLPELTPEQEAECKAAYIDANKGLALFHLKPLPSYEHLTFTLNNA